MPDNQEVRERDGARTGAWTSRAEYGADLIVDLFTPSAPITTAAITLSSIPLWTAAHHHIPLLNLMYSNRSYFNDEEHQILMAKARSRPVEPAPPSRARRTQRSAP